jgi:hypothetical protein
MKLRFATLLLSLLPLAGVAQTLPSLLPTSQRAAAPFVEQLLTLDASGQPLPAGASPVLPIWSGSNGQLLAIVALPPGWRNSPIDATPGYAGPSAWQLAGSSASATGLRWRFGNGLHADATLGQYYLGAQKNCTATDCDAASASAWSRSALTGMLGLGWSPTDSGLDLSYGLSWLQSQSSTLTLGDIASGAALGPVFTLPGSLPYSLDSETALYARGRWQFDRGPALDLGASYGRGHLSAMGMAGAVGVGNSLLPGIDLNQLSLSLGLDAGSLRGAIIGHVISSDDPALAGKRWTTLDLGVSWRTPWSGELSIGAQNLWVAPTSSPLDAENQARTPYIQYRQDL